MHLISLSHSYTVFLSAYDNPVKHDAVRSPKNGGPPSGAITEMIASRHLCVWFRSLVRLDDLLSFFPPTRIVLLAQGLEDLVGVAAGDR